MFCLTLAQPNYDVSTCLPQLRHRIPCGFPSPADDHLAAPLDLFSHLIEHPSATYFAYAEGESMMNRIHPGDLLIVDRAVSVKSGDIIIAAVNGELTCKIVDIEHRCLRSENPSFKPIPIPEEGIELICEGVVVYAISRTRS